MNNEQVQTDLENTKVHKIVVYFVDGEKQETTQPCLTVAQILERVGLDPKTHYLVELRGGQQVKHTDPNETLHIHHDEKFISVFIGPTPLS
ncbi:MAG: hypothetical protein ABSF71_38200 [Terriglobia bacterium]|jgi:outer membrane usher protein FimD/PapC